MRKWIAIALVLLLALGATAIAQEDGIHFWTEPQLDYGYFDEPAGKYLGDMLPTKEDAVAVAQAYIDRLYGSRGLEDHVAVFVVFSEKEEIWTVGFQEPGVDGEIMLGGTIDISLRKSDGAVLDCRGTE